MIKLINRSPEKYFLSFCFILRFLKDFYFLNFSKMSLLRLTDSFQLLSFTPVHPDPTGEVASGLRGI